MRSKADINQLNRPYGTTTAVFTRDHSQYATKVSEIVSVTVYIT